MGGVCTTASGAVCGVGAYLVGELPPVQGVRNVPFRLRIRIERRRNDDEDAKVCPGCTC